MQQGERELFFEMCLGGRGHFHAVVPRRVQHQFVFGDVEQIEQLEISVEDVDLFLLAVR